MENMKNKLQLIFGDWSLGVKGENFHYIFSYKTGGLESFYARGCLLYTSDAADD